MMKTFKICLTNEYYDRDFQQILGIVAETVITRKNKGILFVTHCNTSVRAFSFSNSYGHTSLEPLVQALLISERATSFPTNSHLISISE